MATAAVTGEGSWGTAAVELLRRTRLVQPEELANAVTHAVRHLALDMTIYLVDHEQRSLRPLPQAGKPAVAAFPIDATIAGRAFSSVRIMSVTGRPGQPEKMWLPLVDGSERLGVIEVTAAEPGVVDDTDFQRQCETFAALVGHLIMVQMPYGDGLLQVRRTRPMSQASELLWKLLPPLTFACDRMVISAILEPCYDVGGDGFDYAVNGPQAYLTILDTVGHGLAAGLGTAVALSAMRAARRDGEELPELIRAADATLIEQGYDTRFVTAVLCQLNLETGVLRYVNAGHPAPMLLRRGKVIRRLDRGRRMPLGLDDPDLDIAEELLEPGDRLLLFTDGVTEARDHSGAMFGDDRLAELMERHAARQQPAPETLRRLCHAALDHYDGPPTDDATLMLMEWSAASARRAVL